MVRRRDGNGTNAEWTRRSVVEWLGKATVVALSGKLLAACSDEADVPGSPGSVGDCQSGDFLFEPGPEALALYDDWYERTVDEQEVADLLSDWRLTIDGMVRNPIELSFTDLIELPRQEQVTDFHCVEGWSVYDVPWSGVHLSTLLELVGADVAATHVSFTSQQDVYTESLPLSVALEPKTMIAYGVGCTTLPLRHGFPLRVVVPRKFGYKSAKAIRRIEVTDRPIDGFWVERGYSYEADVQPDRLRPDKY